MFIKFNYKNINRFYADILKGLGYTAWTKHDITVDKCDFLESLKVQNSGISYINLSNDLDIRRVYRQTKLKDDKFKIINITFNFYLTGDFKSDKLKELYELILADLNIQKKDKKQWLEFLEWSNKHLMKNIYTSGINVPLDISFTYDKTNNIFTPYVHRSFNFKKELKTITLNKLQEAYKDYQKNKGTTLPLLSIRSCGVGQLYGYVLFCYMFSSDILDLNIMKYHCLTQTPLLNFINFMSKVCKYEFKTY